MKFYTSTHRDIDLTTSTQSENLEVKFNPEINNLQPVVGDEVGTVTDLVHLNATSSLCPQYLGYTLEQFISCCIFEEEHDTPCQIFPRP